MKWLLLLLGGIILLGGGYFFGKQQALIQSQYYYASITPTQAPIQQVVIPTTSDTITNLTPTFSVMTNTTANALPTAGGGPQNDIIEITHITASQAIAQIGDDISFSVTIKNQAPYKKFIQAICFNSTDNNFGCASGKNLAPGELFNINNSGRFRSSGTKSVWITWTQDNQTFFRPVNGGAAQVTIQ